MSGAWTNSQSLEKMGFEGWNDHDILYCPHCENGRQILVWGVHPYTKTMTCSKCERVSGMGAVTAFTIGHLTSWKQTEAREWFLRLADERATP